MAEEIKDIIDFCSWCNKPLYWGKHRIDSVEDNYLKFCTKKCVYEYYHLEEINNGKDK